MQDKVMIMMSTLVEGYLDIRVLNNIIIRIAVLIVSPILMFLLCSSILKMILLLTTNGFLLMNSTKIITWYWFWP